LESDLTSLTAVGGVFPDGRNKTMLATTVREALTYLDAEAKAASVEELAAKLEELEGFASSMSDDVNDD
jgi:membrane-bound ClpP family serine protease